jgi:hypothetical protein
LGQVKVKPAPHIFIGAQPKPVNINYIR